MHQLDVDVVVFNSKEAFLLRNREVSVDSLTLAFRLSKISIIKED